MSSFEDLLAYGFMRSALLAGLLGGTACAVVGVFVVTMRIAFIGVCITHAAFAGALGAILAGFPAPLGALLMSLAAVAVVGPVADRGEVSPDTATGIVFSAMLGLAFLFTGLLPGAKTEALGLFWGSILTVGRSDLLFLAAVTALAVGSVALFLPLIQAVLCHRETARAAGLPATAVWYGLLLLTGAVVASTMRSMGGLLVFSLIVNPAAAAYQLTWDMRRLFLLAALFGVVSCWGGLVLSWRLDVPSGAAVVLVSTAIFAVCAAVSPKRRPARRSSRATA